MSRRELLATHTAEDVAEWQAFDLLEPIGGDATDIRFGRLTQVLANANRDAKRTPNPWKLEDCTLAYKPPPTPEELTAKMLRTFGVTPPQ